MKTLSASLEMYLKTIYLLSQNQAVVHAKDIASKLDVARPSVTGALRMLAGKKLVKYSPYESIVLTRQGAALALDVLRRYDTLNRFLTEVLSLEPAEARGIACEMEHVISGRPMERLVSYIDYGTSCPRGKIVWNERAKGFRCLDSASCDCMLDKPAPKSSRKAPGTACCSRAGSK